VSVEARGAAGSPVRPTCGLGRDAGRSAGSRTGHAPPCLTFPSPLGARSAVRCEGERGQGRPFPEFLPALRVLRGSELGHGAAGRRQREGAELVLGWEPRHRLTPDVTSE